MVFVFNLDLEKTGKFQTKTLRNQTTNKKKRIGAGFTCIEKFK